MFVTSGATIGPPGRVVKEDAARAPAVFNAFQLYVTRTIPIRRYRSPGSSADAAPSLSLWVAYVPTDRQDRASRSFGILLIRKPRVALLLTLVWPVLRHFVKSVFAEDRMAVEAEQRAYETQGGDWNQEIFPVIIDLRELLMKHGVDRAGR